MIFQQVLEAERIFAACNVFPMLPPELRTVEGLREHVRRVVFGAGGV